MKILVRGPNSKKWDFADLVNVKAEVELQRLFIESPSLIPIDEIRDGVSPLVVAVGEFGLPGSGNTDVLAFTADGEIAIIECKLAANAESKRKVIGQILEYAAFLWGMSYGDVDKRVYAKAGKSLSALVEQVVAEEPVLADEWGEETFRTGVQRSLADGAFILVIVVDEINEELKRIIRYVNECSKSVFSLHALEVRRFKSGAIDVLVPHLHGTSGKSPIVPSKHTWTEEEFFRVLGQSVEPQVVARVQDLYRWTQKSADRTWFGQGKEMGSFTFHYRKEGKTVSVFSVYTDGKLMINYGWLSGQLPLSVVEEFQQRLTQMPSLRHLPADLSKWPTVYVADAFRDQADLEKFKETVVWLHGK